MTDTESYGSILLSAEFFSTSREHLEDSFWFVLYENPLENESQKVVQVFKSQPVEKIDWPSAGTSCPPGVVRSEWATFVSGSEMIENGCTILESMIRDATGGEPILSRINLCKREYINSGRKLRRKYQTPFTDTEGQSPPTLPLSN